MKITKPLTTEGIMLKVLNPDCFFTEVFGFFRLEFGRLNGIEIIPLLAYFVHRNIPIATF